VSDAKEKHPLVSEKIDELAAMLPEKLHKYIPWAAKQMSSDQTIDVTLLADTLLSFEKNVQRIKDRDIESYKTFQDLTNAVRNVTEKQTKSQKQTSISADVDKIYESDRLLAIVPKTEEASCKYGANTRWCVSGKKDNKFEEYKDFTVTVFIINKDKQEKFAYVTVPDNEGNIKKTQIFDEKDKELSEDKLRNSLGDELDVIKEKIRDYVKSSDVGKMSEEKAWKLAKSKDVEKRIVAAKSEFVPQEVLEFLAVDKNDDVRYAVAENENIKSRKVFELLATDEDNTIRQMISLDRNIPTDIIDKMLRDDDVSVIRHALSNKNLSVELIRKFSAPAYAKNHEFIARNLSAPKDVLDKLSKSNQQYVRLQVAMNKNADNETLLALASDADEQVAKEARDQLSDRQAAVEK